MDAAKSDTVTVDVPDDNGRDRSGSLKQSGGGDGVGAGSPHGDGRLGGEDGNNDDPLGGSVQPLAGSSAGVATPGIRATASSSDDQELDLSVGAQVDAKHPHTGQWLKARVCGSDEEMARMVTERAFTREEQKPTGRVKVPSASHEPDMPLPSLATR